MSALAIILPTSARTRSPQAADILAREVARQYPDTWPEPVSGLVTMGSMVDYRDETTGQERRVTLVYPHEGGCLPRTRSRC